MDNDRGIPKTGIPFAVQMVREKNRGTACNANQRGNSEAAGNLHAGRSMTCRVHTFTQSSQKN